MSGYKGDKGGRMIDWKGILNLIIAAIVVIGTYILFTTWQAATSSEMMELFTMLTVLLLYAIFLQLSDIKTRMK